MCNCSNGIIHKSPSSNKSCLQRDHDHCDDTSDDGGGGAQNIN